MAYQYSNPISSFVDPQRAKIAALKTERYEQAMNADNLLKTQLSQMEVSPFENDRLLAKKMRDEFSDTIDQRVQRGDYHNLSRQVSNDATTFVQAYTPLKQNSDAYSEYQNKISEMTAKGDITKDMAQKAMGVSTYGYQGLQVDENGGIDVNSFFSGYTPSKYVNVRERAFDAVQKMVAQKYGGGHSVVPQETPEGLRYFVKSEGQLVEELSPERIRQATQFILQDADVQSYLNQEAMFATYDKGLPQLQQIFIGQAESIREQAQTFGDDPITQALLMDKADQLQTTAMQGDENGLKSLMEEMVKQNIIDTATNATIATFAYKNVTGGGVTGMTLDKASLKAWEKKMAEKEGFTYNVGLFERTALSKTELDAQYEGTKVTQENIVKNLATMGVNVTPEQLLNSETLPPEFYELNEETQANFRRQILVAKNAENQLSILRDQAQTAANQAIGKNKIQISNTLEKELGRVPSDKEVEQIMSIWQELNSQALISRSTGAYFVQDRSTPNLEVTRIIQERINANDFGNEKFEGEKIQYLKDAVLTLQDEISWDEIATTPERAYNNYLQGNQNKFPTTSTSAITNYEGKTALQKHVEGKVAMGQLNFTSPISGENREFTGAEITTAGGKIRSIDLLTSALDGQNGYVVYFEAQKGREKDFANFQEKFGNTSLFLFGNQIETPALRNQLNSPMNFILQQKNQLISMGQTVGKIKLQEGYNLEYENLSGEEKMKFTKGDMAYRIQNGKYVAINMNETPEASHYISTAELEFIINSIDPETGTYPLITGKIQTEQ